jgi:uncharacterized membrane protein YoaK (UPF0700 family)
VHILLLCSQIYLSHGATLNSMSRVSNLGNGTKKRESIFYNAQHGPLPVLLLGLTVLTGIVDAVSILSLGRVFVANMTGNVVFIGLAIAHAPGFALGASLVALAGFLIGAALGGWLHIRYGKDRGRLFAISCFAELFLIVVSLIIALSLSHPMIGIGRYCLSAILAVMMGTQNAVARRLAVPDMTTTVLTMTLTGIAADVRQSGWLSLQLGRRFLAVGGMLLGAIAGGELVIKKDAAAALILATLVMVVVTIGAAAAIRKTSGWRT